jgi:predicted ABC-type ATPase
VKRYQNLTKLGIFVNADEINLAFEQSWQAAPLLGGEQLSRIAQRSADATRAVLLEAGARFSFETVMSHPSKIEFLKQAARAGYRVRFIFVATNSPDINQERVSQRVKTGGHFVPPDRIRERYLRCLSLLPQAIDLAYRADIFDNSEDGFSHIMGFMNGKQIGQIERLPTWADAIFSRVPFERKVLTGEQVWRPLAI